MIKIRFGILMLTAGLVSASFVPDSSWAGAKGRLTNGDPGASLPLPPGEASFGKYPLVESYQTAFDRSIDNYYANRDSNRAAAQKNLDQYVAQMKQAQSKLAEQEKRNAASAAAKDRAIADLAAIGAERTKLETDKFTSGMSDSELTRKRREIEGRYASGEAAVNRAASDAAQAKAEFEAADRAMKEHQGRLEAHVQRDFDKNFKLAALSPEEMNDPDKLKARLATLIDTTDKQAKDQALLEMARQMGDRIQDDLLKSGDLFRDLTLLKSQYKDEARLAAVKNELTKRLDQTLMGQYVHESVLRNLCDPKFNDKVAACQMGQVNRVLQTGAAPSAGNAAVSTRNVAGAQDTPAGSGQVVAPASAAAAAASQNAGERPDRGQIQP